ncbi:MAG: fimbrillin family protein [Rikenellaceae bacterium]
MKKILLYIGIALAAIGCTKEETTTTTPSGDEITFSAGVATRVSSSDDCAWDSTDEIGIFTDQDGEANLKFSIYNTSTGAMTNESGKILIPLEDYNTRTYYAYHPYIADQGETISIDLADGCSTPLLWATETTNDADVELKFTHMLPKVTFELTADGTEVTSLDDATVTLKGAYAKAEFGITSTTEQFSDQSTADITLTIEDSKVTAYLIPMAEVSGNVQLWVTADGDIYIYPITTTAWQSGYEYKYEITVGETNVD